jgi:hypothetical protein
VTLPIWQFITYGLISAVIGFGGGAMLMRVLYHKALKDKEERLATVLERMDTVGRFIKNEILHVPELDEEQKQKK